MRKKQKTGSSKEPEAQTAKTQEPVRPPLEFNLLKDRKQSAFQSRLPATQPSSAFQPPTVLKQPSKILQRSTQLIQSLVKAVNMKDSKMSTGEFKPPQSIYEKVPIRKVQFREQLQPPPTPPPKPQISNDNYLSRKLSEINKRVEQLSSSVGISYQKSLAKNQVIMEKAQKMAEKTDKMPNKKDEMQGMKNEKVVVKKEKREPTKKTNRRKKKSESSEISQGIASEDFQESMGSFDFEESGEGFSDEEVKPVKIEKNPKRPREKPIQKKKAKKSKTKYSDQSMSDQMLEQENLRHLNQSSDQEDYFMMKNKNPRKMRKMNQINEQNDESSEIMACRPKKPIVEPPKIELEKPNKGSKKKIKNQENTDQIDSEKPKKTKKSSKKEPKTETQGQVDQKPKKKRAPKAKKEPSNQESKPDIFLKKKEEQKPADANFQSYLKNKLKNIEQQIQSTTKPPQIEPKPTPKSFSKPPIDLKQSVAISNDDAFSHLKNKIDYFKQKQSSTLRFSKIQPIQEEMPVFPHNSPLEISSRKNKPPENQPSALRGSLLDSRLKQILGNFRQSKINKTPTATEGKMRSTHSRHQNQIKETQVKEFEKNNIEVRPTFQKPAEKPIIQKQQSSEAMKTSKVSNRVEQILSRYQKIFKDQKIPELKKPDFKMQSQQIGSPDPDPIYLPQQEEKQKSPKQISNINKTASDTLKPPDEKSPTFSKPQQKIPKPIVQSPTTRDIGVGQSRTLQPLKNINIVSKASGPAELPMMRDTGLSQSKASEVFKNLQRKVYTEESPRMSHVSRVVSNASALLPVRTDIGSLSTGLVNPEPQRPPAEDPNFSIFKEKNYSNLIELLSNENFEVVIEENSKDPTAQYPELLVASSPKMKQNYQQYGDLVSFQLLGSSYQSIRLGLFVVFNSMRVGVLAGFTILFNASQVGYSRVIEYFFRIHGKEPESILTSYNTDMISSLEFLQAQNIFTGAHVIKAKDVIDMLEKEVKPWDGGSSLETICGYVTSRKRSDAQNHEKAIQKMCLLMPMSSLSKRNVNQILQKKQKICYSYLPRKFIGVGLQVSKAVQSIFQQSYRTYESFPKLLIRRVVEIDKVQKDDNNYQIYPDPVEKIHDDPRLKDVRMALEELVFRAFYKNYVQGILTVNVQPGLIMTLGTFQVKDKTAEENIFEVSEWRCICQYEAKTGLPCVHVMAGAIQTNKDYLSLIRKRWLCPRERGIVRMTPNLMLDSKQENRREQTKTTPGYVIDFADFDEDSDSDKPMDKYPQMILTT